MYQFSKRSKEKLKKAHPLLKLLFENALKSSPVDFGLTEVHRSIEKQQKLFKEGKSKIDGVNNLSKHNYDPAEAGDVAIYVNGEVTWDKIYYILFAGVMFAEAKKLGITLRWGGNFDRDQEILEQDFNDLCHFEILMV